MYSIVDTEILYNQVQPPFIHFTSIVQFPAPLSGMICLHCVRFQQRLFILVTSVHFVPSTHLMGNLCLCQTVYWLSQDWLQILIVLQRHFSIMWVLVCVLRLWSNEMLRTNLPPHFQPLIPMKQKRNKRLFYKETKKIKL